MTDQIKLVQGDDLPYINIALTDASTGSPIDLGDPDIVVRALFKSVLKKTVLSTILCEKTEPVLGKVRFNFSGGVLNVPPGQYEAEIEISFGDRTYTVFKTLNFVVRSQF